MMTRQNVRFPILLRLNGSRRSFFWVSLGLREADRFRALVVLHFEGIAVGDGDN
jgi:hypothetical protein